MRIIDNKKKHKIIRSLNKELDIKFTFLLTIHHGENHDN